MGCFFCMFSRKCCFYDFNIMLGYYFMNRSGSGSVSFKSVCKLFGLYGGLYVYP